MERMERINATDLVVNYVKTAIQNGELKIGDKLPREADMAQELGVGRSSLREGIKILNAYGVVESRQGEGTFVVDNRAQNFFEFMGFFSSKENMQYFLELRRVIEVGNIVDIHDKLQPEDIAELERLVNILNQEGLPEADYIEADKAFHGYMISFRKNPMIIQINNMLTMMRKDLLARLFAHEEIVQDARVAHRKILDALKAQDLDECINAVGAHLDTTVKRVSQVY